MTDGIKYRYNVLNIHTVHSFGSIRGGFQNGCRDVYFLRMLGMKPTLRTEIEALDRQMADFVQQKRLVYRRIASLPTLNDVDAVDFYAKSYDDWVQEKNSGVHIKSTKNNPLLQEQLGHACAQLQRIYSQGESNLSASIQRNRIIKALYWFDALFGTALTDWNCKMNIKIVMQNVGKEQEYLFFYMLTQIGADVLLLQTAQEVQAKQQQLELSACVELGDFSTEELPAWAQMAETASANRIAAEKTGEQRASAKQASSSVASIQKTAENKASVSAASMQKASVKKAPEKAVETTAATRQKKVPPIMKKQNPVDGEKSFEALALLAASVVMIAVHDADGQIIGTGSGIMIAQDGYILTNNHVASGGYYYSVRIEEDAQIYTTDVLIKYNQMLDLALLRIDRRLQPIPIYKGRQKLVRGQRVVAIGSPLGFFNSVSDGIISGFRVFDAVEMIQFTAPISHGSSGGAVLNMQGEVIGISTAGIDSGQNINLAVGYETINGFIRGFV